MLLSARDEIVVYQVEQDRPYFQVALVDVGCARREARIARHLAQRNKNLLVQHVEAGAAIKKSVSSCAPGVFSGSQSQQGTQTHSHRKRLMSEVRSRHEQNKSPRTFVTMDTYMPYRTLYILRLVTPTSNMVPRRPLMRASAR